MGYLKPSNELRFVERETVKILQQKWYEDRHPDINYVEAPSYVWVDVPVEQECRELLAKLNPKEYGDDEH